MPAETVRIIRRDINNPGGGDCAFYAFANGLIAIIQEEAAYTTRTFDRWVELDASILGLKQEILDYSFDEPRKLNETELLIKLQTSLRIMSYQEQLNELKRACAYYKECVMRIIFPNPDEAVDPAKVLRAEEILILSVNGKYTLGFKNQNGEYAEAPINDKSVQDFLSTYKTPTVLKNGDHIDSIEKILRSMGCCTLTKVAYSKLFGNGLYILFAGLVYPSFHTNDCVRFEDSPVILAKIKDLKCKMEQGKADPTFDEHALLIDAFIKLIYGDEVKPCDITEMTEPAADSPVILVMQKVMQRGEWGEQLDLNYLASLLGVKCDYLYNGSSFQIPNKRSPRSRLEYDVRPVIRLNNHNVGSEDKRVKYVFGGWHWTTEVDFAKSELLSSTVAGPANLRQSVIATETQKPIDEHDYIISQQESLHNDEQSQLIGLKKLVVEATISYIDYSEGIWFSFFHRHGSAGRQRAFDFWQEFKTITSLEYAQQTLSDYLTNTANGNTHPHSYRTMLLQSLIKTKPTPTLEFLSKDFDSHLKQVTDEHFGLSI